MSRSTPLPFARLVVSATLALSASVLAAAPALAATSAGSPPAPAKAAVQVQAKIRPAVKTGHVTPRSRCAATSTRQISKVRRGRPVQRKPTCRKSSRKPSPTISRGTAAMGAGSAASAPQGESSRGDGKPAERGLVASTAPTPVGFGTVVPPAPANSAPTAPPVAAVPRPAEPRAAPSRATAFAPGINSGPTMQLDGPAASGLGARVVRVGFNIDTPAAQLGPYIAGYAARGIRVLLLSEFHGRIPTVEDARNLGEWAKAYGSGGTFWVGRPNPELAVRLIEFGNETSMGYQYGDGAYDDSYFARGKAYALRLKEAYGAIAASGRDVGLLAQTDDWTGRWLDANFAAVPDFDRYVSGWTTHPYGSDSLTTIRTAVRQLAAHRVPADKPIDITEWGVASDAGRCLDDNYGLDKCMDYAAAGREVEQSVPAIRQELGGRLRSFMVYQVRDQSLPGTSTDREAYFGALGNDLREKGAYSTAIRALMKAS